MKAFDELYARGDVNVIALSTDPKEKDIKRFLEKGECPVSFPIAFDEGWPVKDSYAKLCERSALIVPCVFIVGADGRVVWREQFAKAHPFESSQTMEQLNRILRGEPLLDNGPAPARPGDADEDPSAAEGEGGDLFETEEVEGAVW